MKLAGGKPVDIKEYLKTGRRPEAPQQGQLAETQRIQQSG